MNYKEGTGASVGTASKRGYLIANYTVHDEEVYGKYLHAADPLNSKYNLKPIICDAQAKAVEGSPRSVIAVAEFPSLREAELFYYSPEYVAAMQYRLASTEGSVLLAESFL